MGKKLADLKLRATEGEAGVGDGPAPEQGAWQRPAESPSGRLTRPGPQFDFGAALGRTLGAPLSTAGLLVTPSVADYEVIEKKIVDSFAEPPPSPAITLVDDPPDDEERAELDAAASLDPFPPGTFSWISGPAGTGKTFLLRSRPSHREELVATTGIAAINLGGCTINSLLGYFDTASLKDAYIAGWPQGKLRALHERGVRRINLDEVSMLDGDALTTLVDIWNDVNEQLDDKGKEPLGLTLCGDFAQLPPVKAPFAFESPEWPKFAENALKLTKVRRQADQAFIEALQQVRMGDARKAVDFFSGQMVSQLDPEFKGSTIKAKNDEVERYNHLKLRECTGKEIRFRNTKAGVQRGEWKQIPDELLVKEGALVMVLSNLRTKFGYTYVNGDLGEVVSRGEVVDNEGVTLDACLVKLHRTGVVVAVAQVLRETFEGKGKDQKVVGSVSYMPVRLAYATTCHKSQGLSLDEVQIDIRNSFFGQPGMLYVALSRARTQAGIRLVGNPKTFVERCATNPRIKGWI